MKHTFGDLLPVVYRFYPRGTTEYDPGYRNSEEYRRLVQTRIQAGAPGNTWRNILLKRISTRLPGAVIQDGSLHLPTGKWDAGYVGWLFLPPRGPHEKNHVIGFLISFLVPCYVVYSTTHIAVADTRPQQWSQEIRFTFSADEEPYVRAITEEIMSVFPDYEPIPPEVGNIIVPDVEAGSKRMGHATLYHCLFTDVW